MSSYGPCVWQACPYKAVDALLSVELVYAGRQYRKKRVPLCADHMREAARTNACSLRAEFLFATERTPA